MDAIKKLIEELKGIAGATDIAAKLADAVKASEVDLDTLKGDASAKKKLEADVKKLTADLAAAAGGADERVTKLTKERDDAQATAAKATADYRTMRLNSKLSEKLGITDPTRQKRALESFTRDYLPEGVDFDDKGDLPGLEKSLKTFREKEAFFFATEVQPNEGGAQGGEKSGTRGPARVGEPTRNEKIDSWSKMLGGETK